MISQSLQQHTQSLHRSKPDCFWCWERKWTQAPFLTQKLPPMNNCSQRKKSFSQWSLTGCKTHTRRQVSPIANNKWPTQNEPSGGFFGGWFIFFACLSGFFCPPFCLRMLCQSFILNITDLLLTYYDSWFCFSGFAVCVNVCLSVSVYVSYNSSFAFFSVYLFHSIKACLLLIYFTY